MYRSLKSNFYTLCLDSAFLNTSPAAARSFYGSRTLLYYRRRLTFISHFLRLRTTVVKYLSTLFFVKNKVKFSRSLLRNLNFLRFIFFIVGSNTRSNSNTSSFGVMLRTLVSQLHASNRLPRTSILGTTAEGTLLMQQRLVARKLLFTFSSRKRFKKSKKQIPLRNLVTSKRLFYFFSRLFRNFTAMSHTCYYYFRMMIGAACMFNTGAGRVSLFFKKLMRLFFFQLCLRILTSDSAIPSTNFKTVACAGLLVDNSIVLYSLGMRLLNYLILDFVSFIQLVTYSSLPVAADIDLSALFAIVAAIRSITNRCFGRVIFSGYKKVTLFSSIMRFFSASIFRKYRFLLVDTSTLLRKTFNFFVNNSSARNVFSALNRGNKMIYGTTSGSFKLKKRIRFKKHAMFMVAAKFNRNISHYYKSKLVRALYVHFTGFRRSFNLVFQFFRNLIRKNAKYHFKPLQVLYKFQPFVQNKFGSSTKYSTSLLRTLPLHVRSIKHASFSPRIRSVFSHLNRNNNSSIKTASDFFLTGVLPISKRKSGFPLLTCTPQRAYSTYQSYRPFSLVKYTVAASHSGTVTPFFGVSPCCSFNSSQLSPWLYSTVYGSIIRTRRQYKLYKKLITPLLQLTQLEASDSFVVGVKRSVSFFSRVRTKIRFAVSSSAARASSYVHCISTYISKHTVRSYSTSVPSNKNKRTFSKKSLDTRTNVSRKKFKGDASLDNSSKKQRRPLHKKRANALELSSFRSKMNLLSPTSYLSVFRTRMAIFLNTIFSGSTVRYRPLISHGGCYRRKRSSDRRYWF